MSRPPNKPLIEPTFKPGEPVLSGGYGQTEWQDAIRARVRGAVYSPRLTFVVSSLRRRGHRFDLDNLVHPVLMVLDEPIDRVAARLYVGAPQGLLIEDRAPDVPPNDGLRSIYITGHSVMSARGRVGIPQIANDLILDEHEGIGLSLEFDRSDIPIRRGWFGPTEAVVDDLVPWLGTYTARELIADHRIRDLRFERGLNPTKEGVRISVWYVPDDHVSLPSALTGVLVDLLA